ncbi:hypothetical protein B566_EDAN005598 [Ephemera danica]|nr:hypothetical protein B566_EDAN005598 [Ephemera danica]
MINEDKISRYASDRTPITMLTRIRMVSSHVTLGVLALLALLAVGMADEIISKREIEDSDMSSCGRKRSDDTMAALPDLQGSEPAVAELSRQILSEAKMWEAIQEARAEIQQRRRLHQNRNPAAMMDRELQITSYRKRRDTAASQSAPHHSQGPRRR